ncbi:MAG: hypothetical protein M1820_005089 [Bogoriella megaspora]|nr:MAG: hypothetical protein M1820_005089 [Bogoriella megaspora]
MVSIQSILLLVFGVSTLALPVVEQRSEEPSRTIPESDFFTALDRRTPPSPLTPGQSGAQGLIGSDICNIIAAQKSMPVAPSPLPSTSLTLSHIAIGRGVQLYNCPAASPSATPTNVGARASLFNSTCLAAANLDFLTWITHASLYYPIPSSPDPNNLANTDLSGHHYFLDSTTPFFNLDTDAHSYGTGAFKKNATSDAPKSPKGFASMLPLPQNQTASVAWLKLTEKQDQQVLKEVYRLNTVGGAAPKTCQGMPESFEVQYAAQYWLFT